jgi:hypothetical protein
LSNVLEEDWKTGCEIAADDRWIRNTNLSPVTAKVKGNLSRFLLTYAFLQRVPLEAFYAKLAKFLS